jgi:hypothetical protein
MGMLRRSTLWLGVLFIQACSSSTQPPAPPAPPAKTIFDPLTSDLAKARSVQQTVDRNKEETKNAIDAQERGDSPQ